MTPSVTLDTGALIGIERGTRRMQAPLDGAGAVGATFNIPAGVLAQARPASSNCPMSRLLHSMRSEPEQLVSCALAVM